MRPIVAGDAELDYAALMETREYLRLWQQSAWPEDDFIAEAKRKDLVTTVASTIDGRVEPAQPCASSPVGATAGWSGCAPAVRVHTVGTVGEP